MRVLVTGGAGFIGHHLVKALVERGDDVVVLDDFSSGQRSRLVPADQHYVVEGSILDSAALDAAAQGCDVILPRGRARLGRAVADGTPANQRHQRVAARSRLRSRPLDRAFGASSSQAPPPCMAIRSSNRAPSGSDRTRGHRTLRASLPPSTTCTALGNSIGVETVALRYFNVFGPGQDPASEYSAVVPRFITAGPRRPSAGDLRQRRDFTGLRPRGQHRPGKSAGGIGEWDDGADLQHRVGQSLQSAGPPETIGDAVGQPIEPTLGPTRPGDVLHSQADVSVAREALGYEPSVSFEEGIARTLEWYRASAQKRRHQ